MWTRQNIDSLMYQQDQRWANLVTRALQQQHPAAKRAKAFLNREWARLYNHWLFSIKPTLPTKGPVDPDGVNEMLGMFHNSLYPAARSAGFPEVTFVFPDIELEGSEFRYPVPGFNQRVAVKGTQVHEIIGLEDFANRCEFTLHGDLLRTSCTIRALDDQVYHFEKTVDLAPAIEFVAKQLAAWHAAEHGDDPAVSGWTDWVKKASSTVKRVAQNKTVRAIYNDPRVQKTFKVMFPTMTKEAQKFAASKVLGDKGGAMVDQMYGAAKDIAKGNFSQGVKDAGALAAEVAASKFGAEHPEVAKGLLTAAKAAKVYEQAKAGSEKALSAVRQLRDLASAGDGHAGYAVKVMQNLSTISQAKEVGLPSPLAAPQKQRRSFYDLGMTAVSGEDFDEEEFGEHFWYDLDDEAVGLNFRKFAKRAALTAANPLAAAHGFAGKGLYNRIRGKKPNPRAGVRDQRGGGMVQNKALNKQWGGTKRRPVVPLPSGMGYETRRPMAPMAEVPSPLAATAVAQPPGAPVAQTTPDLPSDMYDDAALYEQYMPEEAVDEYYGDAYEGEPEEYYEGDEEVSGWLFNRRYRTVSEHLLQSQRSPGIAIAARELYNRGLGRPATSLAELATEAIRSF